MNPKRSCRRTRSLCNLCKQSLGYTAFYRHQELPSLYCPGYVSSTNVANEEDSDSDASDSSFDITSPSSTILETEPPPFPSMEQPSMCSSDSQSSDESDTAPEVWDESDSSFIESDSESDESSQVTKLRYIVCLFLAFFQLCFRISDKALSYLLVFLSALLRHFCSHVKNVPYFIDFAKAFPRTIYSLRKYLKLKSSYTSYVVCPRCHKLYNESQCLEVGSDGVTRSRKCIHIEYPNHPQQAHRKKCGAELMKKIRLGRKHKFVPHKSYVYYSIVESLQRLATRPGFFEQCEEWRSRRCNIPNSCYTDVYDGQLWIDWMRKNGIPYLEVPGNLLFMLNIDWFQPYEHTQYSVGVVYLVIQNLPRAVRFKAENVIIVSTIPGPHEPDCSHLHPYLEPIVNDLLKLWQGVEMRLSHPHSGSKFVRAALSYISCDLPATRKLCGFYGYQASYGCSKCLKFFQSRFGMNLDYSGFDRDSWPQRKMDDHCKIVSRAKAATTHRHRVEIEHEAGVRYSELLRLPYLNVIRCHLVDPMHNLFLGTSKRMLSLWKEKGYINHSNLEQLQQQIDSITPPANIGRIPGKVATGFSGFTAEQFMLWTVVYSPVVLRDILPTEHYMLWCMFSKACALLCKPYIQRDEINKADELLMSFCIGFEQIYGRQACTPNLHMHCHLKECIVDAGPLYSFWCFSFERYNGLLGNMKKSWHAPEVQLIHKFHNLQLLASVILPDDSPDELLHCFQNAKDYRTSLPSPVIDTFSVLKYEQNLFCPPQRISAHKLDIHYPVPPGREKFMTEAHQEALLQMYSALYGADNINHVPLRYTEFKQVRVLEQMYTSTRARTSRSSAIIAVWPHLTGILTSIPPSVEHIRVGIIDCFMLHTPCVKISGDASANASNVESRQHLLARVDWYQDHPHKFFLGNGLLISATVTDRTVDASYLPISRIISRCASLETTLQFNSGEDKVLIVIPVRRDYLL